MPLWTIDGDWEFRVTRPGELYPAGQWARDQQALGAHVLRRRIIVVDDWTEMPPVEKGRSLVNDLSWLN